MIERTVLLKLTEDHATEAGRDAVAERAREMLPAVPGVRAAAVCLPADERSAKDWDVLLRIEFERIEDVAPYAAHPTHRAFVDEFLKPRLAVIKAWNFERP